MSSTTNPEKYRKTARKMAHLGTDKKTAKQVNKMAREKFYLNRDVLKDNGTGKYIATNEVYYQIAVFILMILLPALLVLFFGVFIGFGNDDSSGGGSTNRCEGITNQGEKFSDFTSLRTAIEDWDTDKTGTEEEYGVIGSWDITEITDLSFIISESSARATFNGDIGCWDTSNVTDMRSVFYMAPVFNQDISRWDVSKVTNMSDMFREATAFDNNEGEKQTFRNWKVNTDPEATTTDMFLDATAMTTKYTGADGYGDTPIPGTFFNQNFS